MKRSLVISMVMCACLSTMAQTERFCIASEGKTATIILDAADWKGVIRAARDLGDDVRKVTAVTQLRWLAASRAQEPTGFHTCRHHRQKPGHRQFGET